MSGFSALRRGALAVAGILAVALVPVLTTPGGPGRRGSAAAGLEVPEGHAAHRDVQPDGAGRGPGRPGVLHRPARGREGRQAQRHRGPLDAPERLHGQRVRRAQHRGRPGIRDQPMGLRLLLAEQRRQRRPAEPVHRQRRHDRPVDREGRAGRAGAARRMLPPRRGPGHRQEEREPVVVAGGQHQPVRFRRLQPARPALRARVLGRRTHRGQHQQPVRQGPADPPGNQRHLHDPLGQPVRARHGEHAPGDLHDG